MCLTSYAASKAPNACAFAHSDLELPCPLMRPPNRFTLHKLANMRTGVGKPRPLLDQEKLDLFRDAPRKGHDSIIVAKKFDRLVADVERKMRAALRRLKEITGLD
ncbi:hypothetical protein DPMN_116967 [Dreissena polymorpha]|uniref:Uncharacterized protein n=1 Tax=Dreissena polymorpha TaxID=45954 RepID=A0A9D4QU09_DREPO|nr:hypothetical protein DPMN_116967 [Dreissena polymorpha]